MKKYTSSILGFIKLPSQTIKTHQRKTKMNNYVALTSLVMTRKHTFKISVLFYLLRFILPEYLSKCPFVAYSLSPVWLFATPWTAVRQASLSLTIWEFAQIHVHWVSDAIQPSHPLLPPSPPALNLSQHQGLFQWGSYLYQVAKVLELQLQHLSFQWILKVWFHFGLTGLISLLSKGFSRVFSSTAVQRHQFFSHLLYGTILKSVHDYWKNHSFDYMDFVGKVMSVFFNMMSRFVIAFHPRSKNLLISCLHAPSTVILEPKKIKSATVSIFSPSICHEVMGPDAMILVFWMFLSQLFCFPLSVSSRGSLVPLLFLPFCWCHLHIWGCWYLPWQSWFLLVIRPAWHFTWCTLHLS